MPVVNVNPQMVPGPVACVICVQAFSGLSELFPVAEVIGSKQLSNGVVGFSGLYRVFTSG